MNSVAHGLPLTLNATILNRNYTFLIDTGATTSLIPHNSFLPVLRPTAVSLQTASNSKINCHGELDASIGTAMLASSSP